jgi:hypothetical protein
MARKPKTPRELTDADLADTPETPAPAVEALPSKVQELGWLPRLLLADALLRDPRRFLAACTASEADIRHDYTLQPKASKTIDVDQLQAVLQAFLPGADRRLSLRRLQQLLARAKALDELPLDELETAVARLVNVTWPMRDYGPDGEQRWTSAKTTWTEHAQEVLAEIEAAITARLRYGQRDPAIVATADLPPDALQPIHSDANLNWSLVEHRWLVAIRPDAIPAGSPLKAWPADRTPRVGGAFGVPMLLLGPQLPSINPAVAAPRTFYHLALVERLNDFAWRHWADRKASWLKTRMEHREFDEFTAHDDLMCRPHRQVWPAYPEPAPVPELKGFAARSLFSIDAIRHLTHYLKIPPPTATLPELLAARRIFIDALADEVSDSRRHGAATWVRSWYTPAKRDEAAESMLALASSTAVAVEELDGEARMASLRSYQKTAYPSNGAAKP